MNLQQPNANAAARTWNRSCDVSPASRISARCVEGCRGDCEMFKAISRDVEAVYPGACGAWPAGRDENHPIGHSHLSIVGEPVGVGDLPRGQTGRSDRVQVSTVSTEIQYGARTKVKMKAPILTGTLGSTEIARANWEHFAAGAAISGISIVCGQDVCANDPSLELDSQGKVKRSPDMVERVKQYRRYYEGYGDLIVQMNVEDIRMGVPEYVIDRLGVESVELTWGRGARSVDSEIQVDSLEQALELQRRGCLVIPDPSNRTNQAAFRAGTLKCFERHSRSGFVDQDGFAKQVERLRRLGAKRVTLKTSVYPMCELAFAIQWASDTELDLLTIDVGSSRTGASPWRMVEPSRVRTFYLHSLTHHLCRKLAEKGGFVPDIAVAGGFDSAEHLFNILAVGAPYTKAVCLGRTQMNSSMVGENLDLWLRRGPGTSPKTGSRFGATFDEILVCYEDLVTRYGKDIARELPVGAIVLYAFCSRLKTGLQQLMMGSRNSEVLTISRDDLIALTPEAAHIYGVAGATNACSETNQGIIGA